MNNRNQIKLDVFIIGGGINGVGIARDAAGRGLTIALAEMGDLGGATSSASTKLFHGGLRYLEYFELTLVRESLKERETLLSAMPHISWPMRFVLPYDKKMQFENTTPISKILAFLMPWNKGRRPAWLIKLGLLIYDKLGSRTILPASNSINLKTDVAGIPLKEKFLNGFEYSDCWVEDSRLVILNARDACHNGANIMPQSKVISATKTDDGWYIEVKEKISGKISIFNSKLLINAGGPWVQKVIQNTIKLNSSMSVRLVKGSHIVTKKLYDHEKSYFFQGRDGRIVFAIPYETNFTLIGTTDVPYDGVNMKPLCSQAEKKYLLNFISEYFKQQVTLKDIVWSYSGVRPLYDDGSKSASAVSRDYLLDLDESNKKAPLLNIYGGKITTYRKLAEAALNKVRPIFPDLPNNWTAGIPLPGGDFAVGSFEELVTEISESHNYLSKLLVRRLTRHYGTEVHNLLANKKTQESLGHYFGKNLYAFEIDWAIENEWVTCAEDFIWRRTKLGLHLSKEEIKSVEKYIKNKKKI